MDRVLRPNPGEQAPAPGHNVYTFLGFVPYDRRTPAMRPGAYIGEPRTRRQRLDATVTNPIMKRAREAWRGAA